MTRFSLSRAAANTKLVDLLQTYHGVHSGLQQTQALSASQPVNHKAYPVEATSLGSAGLKAVAGQQAASQPTARQVTPLATWQNWVNCPIRPASWPMAVDQCDDLC